MRNFLRKLTDFIAYLTATALAVFRNKQAANILILTDYIGCGHLLSALSRERAGFYLCCTSAFPFRTLLYQWQWMQPAGFFYVPDYDHESIQRIHQFCLEKSITHVMIQAGTFMVPACNQLNNLLSNDKGNSALAQTCSLDKIRLRKTLNGAGISVLENKEIAVGDGISPLRYPCVLKPAVGTAAEGVYLLTNDDDLRRYSEKAVAEKRSTEFDTKFLIEEYVEGPQFDVEGIIHNGELVILCIIQENYEGYLPEFNYNWYLFNAPLPPSRYEQIKETVARAMAACEVRHGAFHCELRVGTDDSIKILDFANRMGGGFEPLISEATGNDFSTVYYHSMAHNALSLNANKNKRILVKYFTNDVESVAWKAYLNNRDIPHKFRRNSYRKVKSKVIVTTDKLDVIADIAHHFSLGVVGIDV